MAELTTFLSEVTKAITKNASSQVDMYSLEEYVKRTMVDYTIYDEDFNLSFVIRDVDPTNVWQWIQEITRLLCGCGSQASHDVWANVSIIKDEYDGCITYYLAFVAKKGCELYGVTEIVKSGHAIDFNQFIADIKEKLAARKEDEEHMVTTTVTLSVSFEMYGDIALEDIELPDDLANSGDHEEIADYISNVYTDLIRNEILDGLGSHCKFDHDFSHLDYTIENIE